MRNFLFVTLSSFSQTGGIEKFNRAFMNAFCTLQVNDSYTFSAAGMYDWNGDDNYIPSSQYNAGKGRRWLFVWQNVRRALRADELVLGHINLSIIGLLVKWLRPSVKVTLICHGAEVFKPVSVIQKKLLKKADCILAVSKYTKVQLLTIQGLSPDKVFIFPNTLDPFFNLPHTFEKPVYLLDEYKVAPGEKVLFTLTRLNSKEGYKGYDKVIRSIPSLLKAGLKVKYIIGGRGDENELKNITNLITSLNLQKQVLLAGYIDDKEITNHYLLADVYGMPSKGEGFGIVFLEAMACGVPVIAGNKDGSTEALQFGELGTLINPDSEQEIIAALQTILLQEKKPHLLQQQMLQYFSFEQYKKRVKEVFLN